MQHAGCDIRIVCRQHVGRVQRAARIATMHADAGVLPLRNGGLLAKFEGHIAYRLPQRERNAWRRLQHVFAEHKHGVGLFHLRQRGDVCNARATGIDQSE